jgi:hypothetical protein
VSEESQKPIGRVFIKYFAAIGLVLFLFAHSFYSGDINRYKNVLTGRETLYPPTPMEEKLWSVKMARLEIEEKQREYQYIAAGKEIPFPNGQPVIDHALNTPKGHNPPREKTIALLKNAESKRQDLYMLALASAALIAFIASYNKTNNNRKM